MVRLTGENPPKAALRLVFQSAFIAVVRLTLGLKHAGIGKLEFQSAFIAGVSLTDEHKPKGRHVTVSIRFHRGRVSHGPRGYVQVSIQSFYPLSSRACLSL